MGGIVVMQNSFSKLSRRERQIIDIVYSKSEATAADIREALPDNLSDSGVRTILRSMLKKGVLKYKEKDLKYVYYPSIPREKAQLSMLQHIKKTFFENSNRRVISALLKSSEISEKELGQLEELIKQVRKGEK